METAAQAQELQPVKKGLEQNYDRHSTANINDVVEMIRSAITKVTRSKVRINGIEVKVTSTRLKTFAVKGTVCKNCGLTATHFAIERDLPTAARNGRYHLNLWGIAKDGTEVLFTHDHTLARALGGDPCNLENTETMCCGCNFKKGLAEGKLVKQLRDEDKKP